MPREEIYEHVLACCPLSPEHAHELTAVRGFSDETVRRFRFASSGQHMAGREAELASKFPEKDLIESGVFVPEGRSSRICTTLLSDRIIIPYIDKGGRCYHLRFSLPKASREKQKDAAKILGFSGINVEIYQGLNVEKETYDVVLTEGEFKAAAGCQYGIPTVSIPGIASFADKHYPRLVEFLKANKIRKIYIMFDNEVKDDPAYDNYKENPADRYYTQFYAVLMAQKLEKSGHEALIAWLPDEWRHGAKIDIDGALASGRTSAEMARILYEAKPRVEFMKSLPKEAYDVVSRKMAQHYHRSSIRREFNHYVATRQRGRATIDEPVSNFVIKVVATHHTVEGRLREIEFQGEGGSHAGPYTIDPEEMSKSDSFRSFCMSCGDFVWRGTTDDLLTVWESEFLLQDEGRVIIESDHIGWMESEKMWLFGNIAITEDGQQIRPDASNIFWLEKKGVKPLPLSMEDKRSSAFGIPALNVMTKIDMEEVRKRFSESIGARETQIMLGWVNAVAFMEEIFAACNSFPFLFVTGKWQSGKSTVCEWVMNFFGIENAGKAISQTTPVAIQRCLAYFSSLPTFLDEYRNTKEVVSKNGFLRNAYNRQSSGKGMKTSYHSVREARVRGTLVIAGEETPKDGAVWSRCITLYVSKNNRSENNYKWFMANRSRFSSHFHSLLTAKPRLVKRFMEDFEARKEDLLKREIDDRLAFNYAAVMAGYAASFGDPGPGFVDSITTETRARQEEFGEESAISVFLDDLMAMRTRELVDDDYWVVDGGKIYLYFHGLHQVWAQEFKKTRGDEAFKEASIREYLKEEAGFDGINVPCRINGLLKKCVVFDAEEAPESVKNLVTHAAAHVSNPMDGRPF